MRDRETERERDTPLYQVSLSLKLSGAVWKRGRKERTCAISGEKDRNDDDDDMEETEGEGHPSVGDGCNPRNPATESLV